MIRLFYVSTAHETVDQDMVDRIAAQAEQKNTEHEITGALAFNGRAFGQILEGDEDRVLALLDVIANDNRHAGLVEVGRIKITERAFYDWGMQRIKKPNFSDLMALMLD